MQGCWKVVVEKNFPTATTTISATTTTTVSLEVLSNVNENFFFVIKFE